MLCAISAHTIVPTPVPNKEFMSASQSAASSDLVDCLPNGNEICKNRADDSLKCVDPGDALLSDNEWFCTDKYTDPIFKYSLFNVAL